MNKKIIGVIVLIGVSLLFAWWWISLYKAGDLTWLHPVLALLGVGIGIGIFRWLSQPPKVQENS